MNRNVASAAWGLVFCCVSAPGLEIQSLNVTGEVAVILFESASSNWYWIYAAPSVTGEWGRATASNGFLDSFGTISLSASNPVGFYRLAQIHDSNRVDCLGLLDRLRDVVEEHRTAYTAYPSASCFAYEFEDVRFQQNAFRAWLDVHNNPYDPSGFFPDTIRTSGWPISTVFPDWSLKYRYGLVSFLWLRDRGFQQHWYEEDTTNDVAAKAAWSNALSAVPLASSVCIHTSTPSMGIATVWSNSALTVMDPWGRELGYEATAPYDSFRLYSVGPDGTNGTPDDIVFTESSPEP